MTTESCLLIGLTLMAVVTIGGIFYTKTKGFGRFSTSLVLLVSVLFLAALFFAAGKLDGSIFANIAFAVAGYAGGLIAPKADADSK